VVTIWPATKLAMVEQRGPLDEFPALPASATTRAAEHYEFRSVGQDRVAGHDVEVLMAKPRDKHRYAQRLWADRETGLLLRNDVLGLAGEVLESSAFTDVRLGARLPADAVLKPMKKLDGFRVVQAQVQRVTLEAAGWALARPVPGFQLVSCTKRPLDATADNGASVPVLQSVFSDGMSHVSVFIEPYDAQRHKQPLGTSLGATHTLMNRHGDWWVTVVGEVPMATMQLFESMLERKR
jgi:sigma-E factor negative regulatory protein RseB